MAMELWLFNFWTSVTVKILASPSVALWLEVTMVAHAAILASGNMFPGLLKSMWAKVAINSWPTWRAAPNCLANLHKAMEANQVTADQVAFTMNPALLYSKVKFAKKQQLKLVPLGNIVHIKPEKVTNSMIVVKGFGQQWQVQPWKADSNFDNPECPLVQEGQGGPRSQHGDFPSHH